MNDQKKIVNATKEGRLYIKTVDFFNQEKIKNTINELLNSNIITQINNRNLVK